MAGCLRPWSMSRGLHGSLRGIAVVWAVAVTAPPSALAGDLSWTAPATCPERAQVLFELERALGTPLAQATTLVFRVRIEHAQPALQAVLHVVDELAPQPLERVLVGTDCRRLVDELVLAMALASQASPNANPERPAPEPVGVPPATPTAAPPPIAGAAVDDTGLETNGTAFPERWGVSLWMLGDVGSLPRAGMGTSLAIRAGWSDLEFRAVGSLLFEQHATVDAEGMGAAVGGDVGLAAGSLSACVTPAINADWLSLCLGFEAGRLSGQGTGIARPDSRGVLWLAPRADVSLLFPLPGTRMRAGVVLTAESVLSRDEFVIPGQGSVHRPASAVGRAALGVEFASP
jgi:hypothetical protein